MKIGDYKKEVRRMRIMLVVISTLTILLISLNARDYSYYKTAEINLDNLTGIQENYSQLVIQGLRPEYYNISRTITFTTDEDFTKSRNGYKMGECHEFNNDITVFLTGDLEYDRNTLCHEILHNLINIRTDKEEWFVQDISAKGVCFEDD